MSPPHISICICTCGRPGMLNRLLGDIARQDTDGSFTYSVVVTDNDPARSAAPVVQTFAQSVSFKVIYAVEPEKNIASVRNTCLSHVAGDYVAFIDDDEFPVTHWLQDLFRTCETYQVAGVLGPVHPHFENAPPQWIVKGRFYERPTHPTGFLMPWHECRTGNVLFRRRILEPSGLPFRREFGTGGEDQDFFRRMIRNGHRFVWCDEAVAHEVVPPSRWSRRFMLRRALLRGRISLRQAEGRVPSLVKALIAVPLYSLALPFLLLAGQHLFMRYLVKLCDHLGRLAAVIGVNPIRERPM